MRQNIQNVIAAFLVNGQKFEKTCRTDGERIYSYNMVIAERTPDGIKVVDKDKSPSKTTSQQINAVKQFLSGNKIPFKTMD